MKFFKWLAIIIGSIVILLVLALFAHGTYILATIDGPGLDKESKEWVDELIPRILADWEPSIMIENASTLWLQAVPVPETARFADDVRNEFGVLKVYGTTTGEAGVHINNFTATITAEYIVNAEFTNGPARVFVQGIKQAGVWKLLSLHIDRNPNLRWEGSELTDRPLLENVGDTQVVNGTRYVKLLDW